MENAWEKTNIPKRRVSYIPRANPSNFQNMGKVSSNSKGKMWENTNILKLRAVIKYFA